MLAPTSVAIFRGHWPLLGCLRVGLEGLSAVLTRREGGLAEANTGLGAVLGADEVAEARGVLLRAAGSRRGGLCCPRC